MARGKKTGGREAGTPNKVTLAMRERIEREADPIGFLCSVMAGEKIKSAVQKDSDAEPVEVIPTLDQRISAANVLVRKTVPDAKDNPVSFALPEIGNLSEAVTAMSAVLGAVSRGEITPSEGQVITAMIETYRKTVESEELERRIAALEGK